MSEESKAEELLYFNGIDVTTGTYERQPMSSKDLWQTIKGEKKVPPPPENLPELKFRHDKSGEHFGIAAGHDPTKLEEAGWGVIFANDADPGVKEALSELLTWREKQAGDRYRIYEGTKGQRPDESKTDFLARHGAGPGPANPKKVPYYLMIVGSPDRIPYRFQTQLDVQYAVGRIHFDTLDEYANYAKSVVTAESDGLKLPRRGVFFGPANPDDRATKLSADKLVDPLFAKFSGKEFKSWDFKAIMRDEATREQLEALLSGDQTPSLLFTASHGASFPMDNSMQRTHNGALVCRDWPGPREWRKPLPEKFYFAGDHLDPNWNLLGLIAFFFACYGGGTPRMDEFSAQAFRDTRRQIAKHDFLAHLPTKMLSQPKGGALAVIGHVERAWGFSFVWPGVEKQTEVFESTIQLLLEGHPIGSAFEYFNERYAELSTVLNDELEEIKFDKPEDPFKLANWWTANNDARGYAIIGDPAVRLPVADEGKEGGERPEIVVNFKAPPGQETAEAAGAAVAETQAASAAEEKTDAADAATGFAPLPELG
ncbi:MAG: hypothetical protein PVH65_05925, partial [Chloroflexota bacterium]